MRIRSRDGPCSRGPTLERSPAFCCRGSAKWPWRTGSSAMGQETARRAAARLVTRRHLFRAAAAGGLLWPALSVDTRASRRQQQGDEPRAASAAGVPLSRQFGRWAAALRYEDLPADVVDRARGLTLHGLASVLLGSQTAAGKQALALVLDDEAGVRRGAT